MNFIIIYWLKIIGERGDGGTRDWGTDTKLNGNIRGVLQASNQYGCTRSYDDEENVQPQGVPTDCFSPGRFWQDFERSTTPHSFFEDDVSVTGFTTHFDCD